MKCHLVPKPRDVWREGYSLISVLLVVYVSATPKGTVFEPFWYEVGCSF